MGEWESGVMEAKHLPSDGPAENEAEIGQKRENRREMRRIWGKGRAGSWEPGTGGARE